MVKYLIIGAGLSGLSAAYKLEEKNENYLVIESESKVGGLCKTHSEHGFYFDYTGHLLFFKKKKIKEFVRDILVDNIIEDIRRKAAIYIKNRYIQYPFQQNLYGLPTEIIQECLVGFIEAYYKNEHLPPTKYNSFEDWILANLGEGIAKHFMFPYNKKLWTVDPSKMTCEWMGKYVPKPNLEEVIRGSISMDKSKVGYNVTFSYPKLGGIQVLPEGIAKKVRNIKLDERIIEIDLENKIVLSTKGEYEYQYLISSMPLKKFISIIKNVDRSIISAGQKLNNVSVLNFNLGIDRPNISDKHWVYLPEQKYSLYRVGFPMNFSPNVAPSGKSSLYAEIPYRQEWNIDKKAFINKGIEDLIDIGILLNRDEILVNKVIDIEYAYVIYDHQYSINVQKIKKYLNSKDVYTIGRYGNWEYTSMEDAILNGFNIVKNLTNV